MNEEVEEAGGIDEVRMSVRLLIILILLAMLIFGTVARLNYLESTNLAAFQVTTEGVAFQQNGREVIVPQENIQAVKASDKEYSYYAYTYGSYTLFLDTEDLNIYEQLISVK